jgi:putative transposase
VESGPHRRELRRVETRGHARFLTFSCYQRLPLLDHDAIRELFLKRLATVTHDHHVRLLAWVIMPEHTHLLLFPEAQPDIRGFTHALKRPFAEAVLRRWKTLKAPILQKIRHGDGFRYWQTGGGYDRNLFSERDVLEKVNYIHENPLRRKLVMVTTDYVWSSARWYAGMTDIKLPCDPMPF